MLNTFLQYLQFNDNQACVCAEYCELWACSTRTRKPVMKPSLVISSPCSSHMCCSVWDPFWCSQYSSEATQKEWCESKCVSCHQLCQGLWIEKSGGGGESIKNTTAMLPCGLTEMWHREELAFCGFMFPWPFKRGRKKQIQLLLPATMLKVQSKCNTLAPEMREQFHVVYRKAERELRCKDNLTKAAWVQRS